MRAIRRRWAVRWCLFERRVARALVRASPGGCTLEQLADTRRGRAAVWVLLAGWHDAGLIERRAGLDGRTRWAVAQDRSPMAGSVADYW